MESSYLQFIILPFVGAMIGAVTNELAIRMLFRPYKKKYLFGMSLPFTPGVIPRQQAIIAHNIAESFEKHLFSTDEIFVFLTSKKAQEIIAKKVDEIFVSLGSFASFAEGFKPQIIQKINTALEELAKSEETLEELDIKQKISQKIKDMDVATLEKLILGFSRKQFRHITLFGAILGFVIGLVQASFITIFS